MSEERAKVEFGDFQTPPGLAAETCALLVRLGVNPTSIIEPTCGVGNFLFAAADAFPNALSVEGLDINEEYVATVQARLRERADASRIRVEHANFFETEWPQRLEHVPDPLLVVGNPPWVTSSDLGYLKSHNIPTKENFHGRSGLDALTGKSNFDISEWMLLKLLGWLDGRRGTVAMLCKTAVARKALSYSWAQGLRIASSSLRQVNAVKHFGASVDACLFLVQFGEAAGDQVCFVYDTVDAAEPASVFGLRDGVLVADAAHYDKRKSLCGESQYQWRSGVKHDCAAIMELRRAATGYENAEGEPVEIEETFLFPMLKSSDVAREHPEPRRWMVVPQERVGQDTAHIARVAPKTWGYLTAHEERFNQRASSIYRGKPKFSIFGVGDYTFAPWKVAISGLYKKLEFRLIGPHEGKPVVLDDTCYFVACGSEAEARFLLGLLESEEAREFYSAFIFWDAKRPITVDLLRRLDLRRLADLRGAAAEFDRHRASIPVTGVSSGEASRAGSIQGALPLHIGAAPPKRRKRITT
ncbi:hypothetical protein BO221_44380 [Archangium sp. Cb G35]|nr:hypothetical protein BO221_44380 [Archangium sp. Cb G35]